MKILHIYPQIDWHSEALIVHSEALIVGNRDALLSLKSAIDNALIGKSAKCEAYTSDGEGYETSVICLNDKKRFEKLELPYTDEICKEPDGICPFSELIGVQHEAGISNGRPEKEIL